MIPITIIVVVGLVMFGIMCMLYMRTKTHSKEIQEIERLLTRLEEQRRKNKP